MVRFDNSTRSSDMQPIILMLGGGVWKICPVASGFCCRKKRTLSRGAEKSVVLRELREGSGESY